MRPLMLHVLLPLAALAATAIPTDPARAAGTACPRAPIASPSDKAAQPPALVEAKKDLPKLEAL